MDSLVPPSIYKNSKHYKLQRQHIDSIWEKIIEEKIFSIFFGGIKKNRNFAPNFRDQYRPLSIEEAHS